MSHKALGVHYVATLEEAKKEFEKRGYENISRIGIYDRYGNTLGCEDARKRARSDADGDGSPYCYEYQGDEFFPDAINTNRCRIYEFTFERYTGEPGDGVHTRNCRNCGR